MFLSKEEMRKIRMRKLGEFAIEAALTAAVTYGLLVMLLFL